MVMSILVAMQKVHKRQIFANIELYEFIDRYSRTSLLQYKQITSVIKRKKKRKEEKECF